jgi:nitroreductase
MELSEAVRGRRMVRTYDPDRPVARSTIDDLLGLAVRAPSAGHTQGWHFLVLDQPDGRDAFWAATTDADEAGDDWLSRLRTAPALIVCLSDKTAYLDRYAETDKGWADRDEAHWPVPYWHIDTGMAAMIVLLGAQDAGLGACFFGVPAGHHGAVREAFGLPDRLTAIGVVSLGYPVPDRRSPSLKRGRRPAADVISYGSFGSA